MDQIFVHLIKNLKDSCRGIKVLKKTFQSMLKELLKSN